MKTKAFKIKQDVYWKWLGRKINGKIVEVFYAPVTKEIKGKNIKRNGSKDCPAYLVQSAAENFALKLHTELFELDESVNSSKIPQMFSKN